MSLLSSLTNRIFVATALVVVVTLAVTIYRVTIAVTRPGRGGPATWPQ